MADYALSYRQGFPREEKDVYNADHGHDLPDESHTYNIDPPPDRRTIVRVCATANPSREDALFAAQPLFKLRNAIPYKSFRAAGKWCFVCQVAQSKKE